MWLDSLAVEARQQAAYWTYEFDSLYLGGGSPSVLSPDQLASLKEALSPLKISPKAEITLEANPEDVTADKALAWAEWGVTRVSIGAQSFQRKALIAPLGRSHSDSDILKAVEAVKKAKLFFGLDLIFGWPGQTSQEWREDLELAVATGTGHISTYELTIPHKSPIAQKFLTGELIALPESEIADLFLLAGSYLKKRGFERYEVSNFARKGAYSRHNLKYWRRDAYLGLGPAAHSFDGSRRSANVASVDKWSLALAQRHTALSLLEDLTPDQARLESLMLCLRLAQGAPTSLINDQGKAAELALAGFLVKNGAYWKPTEKGLLCADYLARELS
jgi:oxygen-independent coproporphyrinogen-3 oxidase